MNPLLRLSAWWCGVEEIARQAREPLCKHILSDCGWAVLVVTQEKADSHREPDLSEIEGAKAAGR